MPQQIIVSGNGSTEITPVGPVGPPGPPGGGGPGPMGPAAASKGLIASIPAYGSVPEGYIYTATDEKAAYVATSTGWVLMFHQGVETVQILSTSAQGLGTAVSTPTLGTYYPIPGFLSTAFEYDGRTIIARASGFSFGQSAVATSLDVSVMCQITKDGGTTWKNMGVGTEKSLRDLSIFALGRVSTQTAIAGIAPTYDATLVVGDTVQVRLAVGRGAGSSQALQLVTLAGLGALPHLIIEKGTF
jgi:hypothetical protein